MIKPLGVTTVTLPVVMIEWAPRNWSSREAWGPEAQDGFYLTQAGDLYRLCGHLIIFVSDVPFVH